MSEGEKLNLYFSRSPRLSLSFTLVLGLLQASPSRGAGQTQDTQVQKLIPNPGTEGTSCPAFLQQRQEHKPLGSGATREDPVLVASQPGPREWPGCIWIPNIQLSLPAAQCPLPRSKDWVRDTNNEASPGPHAGCAALPHPSRHQNSLMCTQNAPGGTQPSPRQHTSAAAPTPVLEGQLLFQTPVSPHEPPQLLPFQPVSSAHYT